MVRECVCVCERERERSKRRGVGDLFLSGISVFALMTHTSCQFFMRAEVIGSPPWKVQNHRSHCSYLYRGRAALKMRGPKERILQKKEQNQRQEQSALRPRQGKKKHAPLHNFTILRILQSIKEGWLNGFQTTYVLLFWEIILH